MKILFMDFIGEKKNGEAEFLARLKYCAKKAGHQLEVADKSGKIIGKNKDFESDFAVTCNIFDFAPMVIADQFSVFLHWAPSDFMASFQEDTLLKGFHSFDAVINGYESPKMEKTILNSGNKSINMAFTASVPLDYCLAPKKDCQRHLFYIGINRENQLSKMRYRELFEILDKQGVLDIYGPKVVYNMGKTWDGFQSYKGEIPFDGKSVIQKINEAGIVLALNSPMHNAADIVSARIFEAAAAGAVIIADKNPYIKKYFGDSVFYVDINQSESEISKEILIVIEWCNNNKKEAYEMACASQKVFKQYFTLDKMLSSLVAAVKTAKQEMKTLQNETVDIICQVSNERELLQLQTEMGRQFYQNLHLVICCKNGLVSKLSSRLNPLVFDVVETDAKTYGEVISSALQKLRGKYFMFWNPHVFMHKRHIYKNVSLLKGSEQLFAYSGSYIRNPIKNIVLNNTKITKDEFMACLASRFENFAEHDNQVLFLETLFTENLALFKKEILNYVLDKELKQLSSAAHYYLALCSVVKAHKYGQFSYALTAFYKGENIAEVEKYVFPKRLHNRENNRSCGTYFKDLMEIFFCYDKDIDETFLPKRNYTNGVAATFEEMFPPAPLQPVYTPQGPFIDPILYELGRYKFLYALLGALSRHKKKHYPNRQERISQYLKNHKVVKKIVLRLLGIKSTEE